MAIDAYETTRYRCSFCKRSWASKYAAAKHRCAKDPSLRACGTCKHDYRSDEEAGFYRGCALGLQGAMPYRVDCPSWSPRSEHVSHIVELVVKADGCPQ